MYKLVDSSHESLIKTIPPFDFSDPPTDPVQLAKDLAETCMANKGLALAANQVGLEYRCFVIMANPVIACFNPRIVDASSQEIKMEEGCLSYPGMILKVERPLRIKVRYNQPNGEIVTKVLEGITARIFQHELDHINGIRFVDRVSKMVLNKAKEKQKINLRRLKSGQYKMNTEIKV